MSDKYEGEKCFTIHAGDAGSEAYRNQYVKWLEQRQISTLRSSFVALSAVLGNRQTVESSEPTIEAALIAEAVAKIDGLTVAYNMVMERRSKLEEDLEKLRADHAKVLQTNGEVVNEPAGYASILSELETNEIVMELLVTARHVTQQQVDKAREIALGLSGQSDIAAQAGKVVTSDRPMTATVVYCSIECAD